MFRTIEERLEEVLDALDSIPVPAPTSAVKAYRLLNALLADFKAEGIAGRTIRDGGVSRGGRALDRAY